VIKWCSVELKDDCEPAQKEEIVGMIVAVPGGGQATMERERESETKRKENELLEGVCIRSRSWD